MAENTDYTIYPVVPTIDIIIFYLDIGTLKDNVIYGADAIADCFSFPIFIV